MVGTIKFNVGGRYFEVSRLLVDENPDTMLAKMISDTWDKNSETNLSSLIATEICLLMS